MPYIRLEFEILIVENADYVRISIPFNHCTCKRDCIQLWTVKMWVNCYSANKLHTIKANLGYETWADKVGLGLGNILNGCWYEQNAKSITSYLKWYLFTETKPTHAHTQWPLKSPHTVYRMLYSEYIPVVWQLQTCETWYIPMENN